MATRKAPVSILIGSAALVAGLAAALLTGRMPLGVRGEWEWSRLPVAPAAIDVILAGLGVVVYALFAGLGMVALRGRASPIREAAAVAVLAAAAVAVQAVAHSGAPDGYGLAKWVTLRDPGANGYFTVATSRVKDPWQFLADYPAWISRQDALHIGTHPPGLIVLQAILLRTMERSPVASRSVLGRMPGPVERAFRVYGEHLPMTRADRATLALTGFLTLVTCAATVAPLYVLARAGLPAQASWATASLWPLVPSAVLFQPTADTAFPFLSTTALALAAHAGGQALRSRRLALSFPAGLALAVGMQFSLAFLAVGAIVAVVLLSDGETCLKERAFAVLATGAGFVGLTLAVWAVSKANPFVIWWWNQKNHARFYAEFPRSYRAWVVANPVELAVALGLPVSAWACAGAGWPRDVPRVSVATAAVLVFLTLGGRSLSEVGRLWLPFMPALLVAAGSTIARLGAGPKSLAATVTLVGVQTLVLEATIQVVYPV